MNQIIGSFGSRAHHSVGDIGSHCAQTRSAVRALRINRRRAIDKIADTEQTAFFTHVVETRVDIHSVKATIKDSHNNSRAIKTHVVQHIDIQLLNLVFGTTIITIHGTICSHRLQFHSHPTLFCFLCHQVVGATANHRDKRQRIDSFHGRGIVGINRNAIQPFGRIEQLDATFGHSLKILRIDGNVVFIDSNIQIGTTLQRPRTQVGLRIINRIRRIVLVGELHPIDIGCNLCLCKND